MSTHRVYLDHAAATPVAPEVLAAMQPFFGELFYNPSATYQAARSVARTLQDARARVAAILGSRANEVVFTAGGSEANNLAVHGAMRPLSGKNVVVSAIEHDSVLEAARRYDVRVVPVDKRGIVDLAALDKLIDDDTALVSIMYANNEIGTIQPIRDISQIIQRKRSERSKGGLPLLFHTDAAQASNYLDLHVARLGVDMMTLNGGKIYGPKQSGCLFVKAGVILQPIVDGGGQEMGLRSGTENVAAAVGFAEALELAVTIRHDEVERLQGLQRRLIDGTLRAYPSARLNGTRNKRLPNNVHVTFPGIDNERLLIQLDELGIMAAAGSACSASDDEPSHVLGALGLSDEQARSSVRMTLGRTTTEQDVDYVMTVLAKLLA